MMRAVLCTRYGSPDVLQIGEIPRPTVKDREVLIRVHAATATPGDCEMRSFKFPYWWLWIVLRLIIGIRKPRRPVLGMELAGEILETGKLVTRYQPGQRVVASTGLRFGAYAEYATLPETTPMAVIPPGVPYQQAATLPVGGVNALHFLRLGKVQPGASILINGAGGVIGTYAVQIAKTMGGIVTGVDSADKLEAIKGLGATHLVDYQQEDIGQLAPRYDVIFDVTGRMSYRSMLRLLKPEGRYVLANPRVRDMLRAPFTNLLGRRRVIFRFAAERNEDLDYLLTQIKEGRLRPYIDRVFPLDHTAAAHRYVETGEKVGCVVIQVMPDIEREG